LSEELSDQSQLIVSICNKFEIDSETVSLENLKEILNLKVVYLLTYEMEKLLQLFYRLDLNEKKVKEIFAQSSAHKIAPALVDLILERELEKIETRKKYNQK